MSVKDKLGNLLNNASLLPLYDLFGGLSEFWFAVFAINTMVLEWKGKLEPNFAITITAITAILMAHEALDDLHSRSLRNGNQNSKAVGSGNNQT